MTIRMMIFGAMALLVGFVFWNEAREIDSRAALMSRHGVTVNSDPIAEPVRNIKQFTVNLPVVWQTLDGKRYAKEVVVSDFFLDCLVPGKPIKIRYLPDNPHQMEVVGEEKGSFLLYLGAFLFSLIGLWMIMGAFLQWKKSATSS